MNEKVVIIIRPNGDDSDQILIVTIYLDLGDARTISATFLSSFTNLRALDLECYCGCAGAALSLSCKLESKTI
jgi:hypothetical protein